MTHQSKRKRFENFLVGLRERQTNVVWPHTLANGAEVDRFLWHGSSNPTMVQRIGLFLLGVVIALTGTLGLFLTYAQHWIWGPVALPTFIFGVRITYNSLRHADSR